MDKIFDPLYSTRSFGVGLGLPIVEKIMRAHGGRISIENNPDAGCTAKLEFTID